MMNPDVTKAKEDGSSSVVGDEANPRIIEKPVGLPGTDQSPRDANESEDNAKPRRNDEEADEKEIILFGRHHETESHADDSSKFVKLYVDGCKMSYVIRFSLECRL
ncbi:Uncharacterized protein Rs2_23391 [Raphanus sativus]|nr:Uncharacterized protein Rs2_23391 [Raphanus sativus]